MTTGGKTSAAIQLIVGLGNPGAEYQATRHNAGAWFVEALCEQFRLTLKTEAKFNARVGTITQNGKEFRVAIPNTFMNHSGQAVSSIAKYYQIPLEAILIAHDDLDLPAGTVRFKTDGGHGGHNGLRDIIFHMHHRTFHRLRIGIGHPGNKDHVLDFVLHRPSKAEEQKIHQAIENALQALPTLLAGNFQATMNQLHRISAEE